MGAQAPSSAHHNSRRRIAGARPPAEWDNPEGKGKFVRKEKQMDEIELRVRRLERDCRIYRTLFVLAGLMLLALISYGAVRPPPEVIQANRFEAVDKNGRVRAVMASFRGHGDGIFRAYNRAGVEVFYAGSSGAGDGRIEVKTKRGKITVAITGKRK